MYFLHRIQFQTKKYNLFRKNWKKSNFFNLFFKIYTDQLFLLQFFQISVKKFQNWVSLYFANVLKIKVTKAELIISNYVETVDQYLLSPPPHWQGLRTFFLSKNSTFSVLIFLLKEPTFSNVNIVKSHSKFAYGKSAIHYFIILIGL